MSPREELEGLAQGYRLGRRDLADVLHEAYLLGLRTWQQFVEQASEPSFRVVDHEGKPFDRRTWATSGPATLALRHSGRSGTVQRGQVIWQKGS